MSGAKGVLADLLLELGPEAWEQIQAWMHSNPDAAVQAVQGCKVLLPWTDSGYSYSLGPSKLRCELGASPDGDRRLGASLHNAGYDGQGRRVDPNSTQWESGSHRFQAWEEAIRLIEAELREEGYALADAALPPAGPERVVGAVTRFFGSWMDAEERYLTCELRELDPRTKTDVYHCGKTTPEGEPCSHFFSASVLDGRTWVRTNPRACRVFTVVGPDVSKEIGRKLLDAIPREILLHFSRLETA